MRRRWLRQEVPPLVIIQVGTGRRTTLQPLNRSGDFDAKTLALAAQAFRYKRTDKTHPINLRLLKLIYTAARRFKAPYIYLISGYRPGRATSRHTQGKAADIVIPGVPDRRLAAYFRRKKRVGVGFYPVSGFTHIDVRKRSYHWTDRSPPD